MSLDFPLLIDPRPSQKFASLTSASRVAKQVQEASGNQQDIVISKIMQILSNVSLFAQQVHESSETYNQLQAGSFDEAGALFYLQTPERIAFVLDFLAKDDFWDPQAISIELEQNPDLLNQLDAMTLHIDLSHDSQNMHRLIKFFRDLDPKNSGDWKKAQSLYTLYSYFNEKPPVELIEVIGKFWDQAFHESIDHGEFDQFAKTLKTHECFSKISDLKDDEVEFFNQLKPFWNNLTSLSFHFSVNNGTVLSILKETPAVIGLSFSHRELTNELIELVCRLKKLKELTLVGTKFDDSSLFKIMKSIQLKKLSLDYPLNHSFLKQIPWDIEELDVNLSDVNSGILADSLSRFIHIRKLSLNFLEKNINFVGIPHLPKLEELKLKSSHVSGSTILGGLGLLNTDLKRLNIENIKFSSLNQLVLPDQFNRLEELDLNGSDPVLVQQFMDRLAIPSVIKKLNLENTHCEMTDQLAFNIGLLTSLEELNILSINNIKSNRLRHILVSLKKLKTLSLGKSDSKFGIDLFTDSPVFLANLEKLHQESVSIKDVRFNKSKLKTLRLINCEGFRDDLLSNFPATALARLEKVDLSQSAIRDGGLAYLSNLALGLQELILDDCVLVGGDFTLSKEAFSNLQVLSLKGSVVGPPRIGDQGIYEILIRAKNLRELYLNQNSLITGSTFEKLPNGSLLFLKKLTLGLHFDKIGQLPEGALSRLNELLLYRTNISYEKLSSFILARTKDLKILGLKRCDNLESENLGQIVSTLSDLNFRTDKPADWSLPNLRQLLLETNIREQHACDLLLKTSKLQRLTLISDKVDGSRLSQLDSSVFSHLKFIVINNIHRYREAIISKLPPENLHH